MSEITLRPRTPTDELKAHILEIAPPRPKAGLGHFLGVIFAILVILWAFDGAKFQWGEFIKGLPQIVETMGRMWPPDFSRVQKIESYSVPQGMTLGQVLLPMPLDDAQKEKKRRWWNNTFPQTIVGATIQTIQMALAGTLIAVVLAFPLAFLAAANTTPHPMIYQGTRFALNLLRTIPDLALGLIFVAAVGLGAFAGTLALAVHTTTVLGKLLSEAIENIDEGVVEAIKTTGANYPQVLAFAVVPQMLPDLISFTLYRFETNIRAAAVLGLIGAGGIGYLLTTAFRTFQFQEALAIVLLLIVLVMAVDFLSAKLRRMVL